jgi:ATP-dependent DNA helicase RecG
MMVWNEGSLPSGLTVENLKEKHPSLPKNPILAEVCFKGGLIEAWGRGIPKVVEECKKWDLPEPKIELLGGGIAITLYKNKYTKDYLDSLNLSERQLKCLEYIKEQGQITNSIYQEINTITDRTARRDINELVEVHQLLVKHGTTKGAYYTFVGDEGNENSDA